ncbi:hypothetical protein [Rhizobium sp. BK060]|uniref:hypothetical protein n=1 Tax=Rhizobium sp. BK060 TaxID=2587096 RepID=UPI0016159729|nr:hypothetical protein [Rhizobium sp. BK060]MBB3397300.1 hypothetical protein [Rhizobium sp. BK060]
MPVGAKAGGFSFYHDETKQKPGAGSPPPGPDADLDALQETNWRREEGSGRQAVGPRAPILKFLRKGNQVLQKCVAEHSRRSQIVERDFVDHMPRRKVSNGAVAQPIFDAVQRRTSIDWT